MFTGLCALLWSIWLSRNDIIFRNSKTTNRSPDPFQGHLSYQDKGDLQKEEDRALIADACRALEVTAMDIFARNG